MSEKTDLQADALISTESFADAMKDVFKDNNGKSAMASRFRGYLPVVIDLETGGFNAATDAVLEIAATLLDIDSNGQLVINATYDYNIKPFTGARVEQAALDFTGIDPDDPERNAVSESDALEEIFHIIRQAMKAQGCTRAILVGHNAHFDLGFLMAATERCHIKRSPFHPFTVFDTATLSGLAYGHTVLAKACELAGIEFSNKDAHSAAYDSEKTAELFCKIINRWQSLGGWPR
jgi:ribonuclease T